MSDFPNVFIKLVDFLVSLIFDIYMTLPVDHAFKDVSKLSLFTCRFVRLSHPPILLIVQCIECVTCLAKQNPVKVSLALNFFTLVILMFFNRQVTVNIV